MLVFLFNRLKPCLDEIIAYEQSAIVKGQQIQDSIFIVQEVLHDNQRKKEEIPSSS